MKAEEKAMKAEEKAKFTANSERRVIRQGLEYLVPEGYKLVRADKVKDALWREMPGGYALVPMKPKRRKTKPPSIVGMTACIRQSIKQQCRHERTNDDGTYSGTLNIKWHEHSNHIIMGICGTCLQLFDCSNPQDLQWFLKDPRAQKNMGKARASQADISEHPLFCFSQQSPPMVVIQLTAWEKFTRWVKTIFS